MSERLRFHSLVPSDLRDAIGWYDGISEELGDRFRESANLRFDEIASTPGAFPVAFDDVRFARIRGFPYLILFRESRTMVHILGVFHGSSDPQKWKRRAANGSE